MAPIRGGNKNKRKMDEKDEEKITLVSGSAEEGPSDWLQVLSISSHSPSKGLDSFASVFKMSRKTFDYICSLVEENMSGKFTFSSGQPMSLNEKVAVALRRLSTGYSLIAIGNSLGAHHSTVSQITRRFVDAMEEKGMHHIGWPSTEQEMTLIKSKFQKIQGLPNCCGAVDATHINMLLSSSEPKAEAWQDRKNKNSMILQAVVDPDLRFRDVVTGLPGRISEKSVLQSSNLYTHCENGELLNGTKVKLSGKTELREYIVGDSAFPLLPWLVTPYQGNNLSEHKAEFNRRLLATHVVAKRALGRLKENWKMIGGQMWRPDKHKLPRLILVCCILHNIVIDMEDEEVLNELPAPDNHDPGYPQEVCESVDKTTSVLRDNLSRYLSRRPHS